jgi:tetratricopeptide (TPR) repeat protein
MDGRYDDADHLAGEALEFGQAQQNYGVVQYEIGRARGGLEGLEPLVIAALEENPHAPAFRSGLVYLYSMLDRPDDMREHFNFFAENDFANLPADVNFLIGTAALVVACAYLGDRDRANRLYEMLEPFGEFHVVIGPGPVQSAGSVEGFLALAAATAGRWDVADEHFARGLEANERSGNRPWSVHIRYEYARLLTRRDDPDDQPRLQQLLRECLAGATDMGMTRVIEQTRALADAAGVEL